MTNKLWPFKDRDGNIGEKKSLQEILSDGDCTSSQMRGGQKN